MQEEGTRRNKSSWKKNKKEVELDKVLNILICILAKDLQKAKKELDDAEIKRALDYEKKKKKEAEIERQRMLEQLARDKEEKFGKKFDPYSGGEIKKDKSPFELALFNLKAVKLMNPTFRAGDLAKNCFNTIRVVLTNIVKNPDEEKFRKCKTTNPNFEERVGKVPLGLKALENLGFEQEGDFLVCKNPDFEAFKKVIAYLEEELSKME
jgi:hypothetical protein